MGTNKTPFDVDGHHRRWTWTPLADQPAVLCGDMYKRMSFVPIWPARPRILDGSKHVFFYRNGTNNQQSFRSVWSHKIE